MRRTFFCFFSRKYGGRAGAYAGAKLLSFGFSGRRLDLDLDLGLGLDPDCPREQENSLCGVVSIRCSECLKELADTAANAIDFSRATFCGRRWLLQDGATYVYVDVMSPTLRSVCLLLYLAVPTTSTAGTASLTWQGVVLGCGLLGGCSGSSGIIRAGVVLAWATVFDVGKEGRKAFVAPFFLR